MSEDEEKETELNPPYPEEQNQEALDAVIADARAMGFTVYRADGYTLLLDLDHPAAIKQYAWTFDIVKDRFGFFEVERWKSKSGKGLHVLLRRPFEGGALGWAVRYALEMALGSDPKRGVLALHQMHHGCDEASFLFRPTAKSKK